MAFYALTIRVRLDLYILGVLCLHYPPMAVHSKIKHANLWLFPLWKFLITLRTCISSLPTLPHTTSQPFCNQVTPSQATYCWISSPPYPCYSVPIKTANNISDMSFPKFCKLYHHLIALVFYARLQKVPKCHLHHTMYLCCHLQWSFDFYTKCPSFSMVPRSLSFIEMLSFIPPAIY